MQIGPERAFIPLNIAVLTVSDTRAEATDVSGALLVERLTTAGHRLWVKRIVKDDLAMIRLVVSEWLAAVDVDVILTTGGTGVTGRDGTPEAVRPLLEKELEGFGELFRFISFQAIGSSALQSRALAGVSQGKYVFCLPGSAHACVTAWDGLICAQLDYRTKPCNLVELMSRLKEV